MTWDAISRGGQFTESLPAVRMTDRASKRIGRIGTGVTCQLQQPFDHVLHLFFRGMTVADHRLLDLQRGVLGDRQFMQHRRANRSPARLAEEQR